MLDKQDPAVFLIINDSKYETKRVQEGGTKASFPEVFDDITACYIDDILAEVHNVDANGNSKKLLGTGKIKISEAIARQHQLASDSIMILLYNADGKPRGKITMTGIFERLDDDNDDDSEASNITEGEVYNVNPLKNVTLHNKIFEEETTLPAFIDISSITVVDIKSVHVVSSNKNEAYLTYKGGETEQTFSTENKNSNNNNNNNNYNNNDNNGGTSSDNNDNNDKLRNMGKAAEWLSLHWTFQVVENASLIFDIKSLGISSLSSLSSLSS